MKKRTLKIFAVALCCIIALQAVLSGGFSFESSAATDGVLYETGFSEDFDSLKDTGLWDVETDQRNDSNAPNMNGSAMVMKTKDSVKFNWTRVNGVGEYSTAKSYTCEFDAKLTDPGNGNLWTGPDHTRILYVAFGGWYNQVEINNKDGKIRAGDTYTSYSSSFNGKTLHITVTLSGNTVTSIVSDTSGNVIAEGSRTNSSYSDMTTKVQSSDRAPAMTYLVLRCEDGGVELDNFKFSVQTPQGAVSTPLNIPSGKLAVYECSLNYTAGSTNSVKLGGNEILSLSGSGLKVCSARVNGIYPAGTYGIKAVINPLQTMMFVEVTLPDGGVLRRGIYSMLGGNDVSTTSSVKGSFSTPTVTYEALSLNSYELVQTEPTATGFEMYLYNIITSFDDATTTRNFSWTVKEAFLGGETFAVKYRVKGETAWQSVDAIKKTEKSVILTEDYYEAYIKNLKPDTEYEYKIGIKTSSDDADWTLTYTFTTAPKNVKEFSFIAVGDTQGQSWSGDTTSTKGYKYAMAAIEEAMQENPDAAFILNAGDVSDNGDNLNHWNWYFKSLGLYATSVPHFATQGNHDTWVGDQNNYFSLHFNHPNNGSNALDPTIAGNVTSANGNVLVNYYNDTIYSYDYGEAHFIVLNSGVYGADDIHILKAQRTWLEEDLKANADARWTIILVHEAVYHRLGESESRPWLYDTIEKYGVDLVIQGHSHLVTRTYPMKDGQIVTKTSPDLIAQGTGTVYTTIGSTTLNHDSLGNPNVEECLTILTPDNLQPTYTVVSVKEDKLVMTVKQVNGYVLDEFTITADPNYVPPTDNGDDGNGGSDNGNNNGGNNGGTVNDGTGNDNGTVTPDQNGNATAPQDTGNQTPVPSNNATADSKDDGGCGSVISGATVIAIAVMTVGMGISIRNKE